MISRFFSSRRAFRKFLTDDIQLEEVLQVRIRQCRIFAAALEDLSVVVGNGWEYQRAQNHRRVAALHHLPANSMIGRRDNLEPISNKEGKRSRTAYRTLKYRLYRPCHSETSRFPRSRWCERGGASLSSRRWWSSLSPSPWPSISTVSSRLAVLLESIGDHFYSVWYCEWYGRFLISA